MITARRWLTLACVLAGLVVAGCNGDGGAAPMVDAGPLDATDTDGGPSLVTGAHDVLFVGNSYIQVNGITTHYRAIAETLPPQPVRIVEVTTAGYTLAAHAADAHTDGRPLSRWLRTGTADDLHFDAVVLQEQSQIGGYPEGSEARTASLAGARDLAGLARAHGVAVVLYQTWGREHGDPGTPGFETFTAMQDRLDAGYLGMAAQLYADGSEVRIAPVGAGFRAVWDDITAVGGDPLAAGSAFAALYEDDGSHPSARGAYLAACVIAGTITGADPRRFPDEPTLEPAASAALREVCARVVADPRWRPKWARALPEDALIDGDGASGSRAGQAVALGADGQRLIVGRYGTVGVWRRAGAGWALEATLASPDSDDLFGVAVAVSSDGTRVVVGAPMRTDGVTRGLGAVHIYVRTGTAWAAEGMVTPDPPLEYEMIGRALALSADGGTVLVGAHGHADVWRRGPGGWARGAVLRPGPGPAPDGFGMSVALSADGARALIGHPNDEAAGLARAGSAHVFSYDGAAWTEEARLVGADASAGDAIGYAVALDAAGTHALVGGFAEDGDASAHVFVRSGSTWTADGALRPSQPRRGDGFGFCVALAEDGRGALIGAPGGIAIGAPGRAWWFRRGAERWDEQALLQPVSGEPFARFAASLTVRGGQAAVGEPLRRVGATFEVGGVRTFTLP